MGATHSDESVRNLNKHGRREARNPVEGKAWENFLREPQGIGLRSLDIDAPKLDSFPWCCRCKTPTLFFEATESPIEDKASTALVEVAKRFPGGRAYVAQFEAEHAVWTHVVSEDEVETCQVASRLTRVRFQQRYPIHCQPTGWYDREEGVKFLEWMFENFHDCDEVRRTSRLIDDASRHVEPEPEPEPEPERDPDPAEETLRWTTSTGEQLVLDVGVPERRYLRDRAREIGALAPGPTRSTRINELQVIAEVFAVFPGTTIAA